MKAYFLTDVGQVRSHNEDSGGIFYNTNKQMLAVIADGMGGHQGGDIASELATNVIQKKWENASDINNPKILEDWITETINEANEVIYNQSKEKADLEGMGTTVVLVVCTEEFITIAHVGDSRCYIYQDEAMKQLTEDHSLVNELIRSGQISVQDAELHPRKNVLLRAVGTEESVNCEIQTIEWEAGSKLLLCSDGLTNKVSAQELKDHLSQTEAISEIGKSLIDLANERGGEDNISLIIVHYDSTSEAGEES